MLRDQWFSLSLVKCSGVFKAFDLLRGVLKKMITQNPSVLKF